MTIVNKGVDSSKLVRFLRSKYKTGETVPLSNETESVTLQYAEKEPVPLKGDYCDEVCSPSPEPSSGYLVYSGDLITQVNYSNGRTVDIIRDMSGSITATTDGTTTYSFSRDSNGRITSWTVS